MKRAVYRVGINGTGLTGWVSSNLYEMLQDDVMVSVVSLLDGSIVFEQDGEQGYNLLLICDAGVIGRLHEIDADRSSVRVIESGILPGQSVGGRMNFEDSPGAFAVEFDADDSSPVGTSYLAATLIIERIGS